MSQGIHCNKGTHTNPKYDTHSHVCIIMSQVRFAEFNLGNPMPSQASGPIVT